jgi:hypothetical protein
VDAGLTHANKFTAFGSIYTTTGARHPDRAAE